MTQSTDKKEWYLSNFESFEQSLNGASATPLHQIRRSAIEQFGALGFPTTRDEEWRYTNIAPITRTDFTPVLEPDLNGVTPSVLEPFTFPELECVQLVFVDGHYAAELSTLGALPEGVEVTDLITGLAEHSELVEPHLGHHASCDAEPFTALNTAFVQDGAFIHLPRGKVLELPIHLLFFATEREKPALTQPRVLIVAEENSQVTVVESYAGAPGARYLTNAVTEIVAGPSAVVDHYRIQRESDAAFHVSDLRVRQARDVQFRSTCITLSGLLTRNHVHTALDGEGIDSTLNGLYLVEGEQHVDNHTLIEHLQPHCASHEFYKGILDGKSTGVFRGQILVHQAAQQTDAYQQNQNLLLSEEAAINTKPQLEIYADDVKCSHGATIGQLDPDAVFYLRSRGIGVEESARLLTHAFAGAVVERIRIDAVRQRLDHLVTQRLLKADDRLAKAGQLS